MTSHDRWHARSTPNRASIQVATDRNPVLPLPISSYMVVRVTMKTTIELADDLAVDARRYAARHRVTLRSIIEDGIRMKLRTERTRSAFRLRDAAVKGSGLQPEFRDAGWPAVRKAIYEGRGA